MNPNISGTKPNLASSQLLVSTGIPTLDALLGGGVPVGATIIINEDQYGTYSKVMLKYFIAEAVVSNQASLTISLDANPSTEFINNLPSVNESEPEVIHDKPLNNDDEMMRIAFRYQNLPTREKEIKHRFGHYYDLSTNMDRESIDLNKHKCISKNDIENEKPRMDIFKNCAFNLIIERLVECTKDPRFSLSDESGDLDNKTILRLNVHRLGSIMWGNLDELPKFLYHIRCIMRQCFGIAYITIPSSISEKLTQIYENRLLNISDIALSLISFTGTHYEKNKYLAEYHGFFNIDKLAPINSFVSPHPGPEEYTFKLLRKKFCIEKLHLPPDVNANEDKPSKGSVHSMNSCGSGGKSRLDF